MNSNWSLKQSHWSPKPLFVSKGKIKLQLHTFLPMMSWKCMLTAWSTDCSASKVINPKPSQRPRVNQGSRGLWQHKMRNSIGLPQSEGPSRLRVRMTSQLHKSNTKSCGLKCIFFTVQWIFRYYTPIILLLLNHFTALQRQSAVGLLYILSTENTEIRLLSFLNPPKSMKLGLLWIL